MEARLVSITTNLSSDLMLEHGSSTLCEIRVTPSGGPSTFTIAPASVPAGISLSNGQQSVSLNGSVFVGLTINVEHAPVYGDLTFSIETPKRQLLFGLERFKVENCRSKGDHHDADTLIVVVSTNRNAYPAQQILLGDNLLKGNEVFGKLVGPFEIDDQNIVTATFTVLNGADGNKAVAVGTKIVGTVLGGVAGLEEAHFLGLAASGIEKGIMGAACGIFGTLGELLGVHQANPDCSGAVLVRVFTFAPGQLRGAPLTIGPTDETQRSPSECGSDPHATVTYSIKQVS